MTGDTEGYPYHLLPLSVFFAFPDLFLLEIQLFSVPDRLILIVLP